MSDTGFDGQRITAGTGLILSLPAPFPPASLFTPTPEAARRVLEFFTAQINNGRYGDGGLGLYLRVHRMKSGRVSKSWGHDPRDAGVPTFEAAVGLAHELKQALATYTESGGTGKTTVDQSEAVAVMLEKYEVCRDLFHGFDYSGWIDGTSAERVSLLPGAQEHILAQGGLASTDRTAWKNATSSRIRIASS